MESAEVAKLNSENNTKYAIVSFFNEQEKWRCDVTIMYQADNVYVSNLIILIV